MPLLCFGIDIKSKFFRGHANTLDVVPIEAAVTLNHIIFLFLVFLVLSPKEACTGAELVFLPIVRIRDYLIITLIFLLVVIGGGSVRTPGNLLVPAVPIAVAFG